MASFVSHHTTAHDQPALFVAEQILTQLKQGKHVLWLLSGGSGGAVCVSASQHLKGHDLSGLSVCMSDERYGQPGHADENFLQLMDAGLSLPGATLYRTLNGKDQTQTTQDFAAWLEATQARADYSIAVLGIGEDGHTCGVKPHSIGVTAPRAAVSFEGDDFIRITISLAFLRTLDEAVVQAFGARKQARIAQLEKGTGSVVDAPMLAIRDIAKVQVFSD